MDHLAVGVEAVLCLDVEEDDDGGGGGVVVSRPVELASNTHAIWNLNYIARKQGW